MLRFPVDDLGQETDWSVGLEGRPVRQQCVENCAQGIDISSAVDILIVSPGLFGRHKGWCAQDLPGTRERVGVLDAGQAEIDDEGHGGSILELLNQNVVWFEVPVDDSLAVGEVYGLRDGPQHSNLLFQRHRYSGEVQRFSIDELHDKDCVAVAILADFKDLADIGVVQAGLCLGLARESLDGHRVVAKKRLQRHPAVEILVPSLEDFPYASGGDGNGGVVSFHRSFWIAKYFTKPENTVTSQLSKPGNPDSRRARKDRTVGGDRVQEEGG